MQRGDEAQKSNPESIEPLPEEQQRAHQIDPMNLVDQESYDSLLFKWKQAQRNSLRVTESQALRVMQKTTVQSREKMLEQYCQQVVYYMKAKYVLEEIIEPIVQHNLLDLEDITKMEFMYFVTFRAWCDIHIAEREFIVFVEDGQVSPKKGDDMNKLRRREFLEETADKNIKYLVEPMFKAGDKIEVYFERFHRVLIAKEKLFKNRLRALKDLIFRKREKDARQKYIEGLEGVNFQRHDQINYTQSRYIPECISWLEKRPDTRSKSMISKLQVYSRLLEAKIEKLEGLDDFEILKRTMEKEWEEEQRAKKPASK